MMACCWTRNKNNDNNKAIKKLKRRGGNAHEVGMMLYCSAGPKNDEDNSVSKSERPLTNYVVQYITTLEQNKKYSRFYRPNQKIAKVPHFL